MTTTKIIGALCGTFLIFLLVNWGASSLYDTSVGSDHGEVKNAYVIEVEEAAGEEMAMVEEDFAVVLAAADVEKGARAFGKCTACHTLDDGVNKTGPTLFSLMGRDIASVAGYGYSGALTELPGDWSAERLNDFLENPRGFAPGTKMTASVKNSDERANLIAYLISLGS